MAIPSVLQARLDNYEQEEQQNEAAQESTSHSEEPEELENTEQPEHDQDIEESESQEDTESTEQEADQSAENDQNFKRMEGRYKAEIKRLKEQMQANENEKLVNQRIIQQLIESKSITAEKPQENPKPEPKRTALNFDLTDEEKEVYGDMLPLIEKITKPLVEEINSLRQQNNELFDGHGQFRQNLQDYDEQRFIESVKASVPNFSVASENNPDWKEFLEKPVPLFHGQTYQDVLLQAHKSRQLQTIQNVFKAFDEQYNQSPQDVKPVPTKAKSLGDLATPDKTASDKKAGKRFKYRASDHSLKFKQMLSGQLSKEDFIKFEEDFQKASSQGQVAQD